MAEAPAFETVTAAALRTDPARAIRLAALACSAQPAFYEIIPASRDAVLGAVARQIADPRFDMADALVLREDAAIVTGVALPSLAAAQMAAMAALLRLVPGAETKTVVTRLRAYSAGIEPIEDSGHYISRVAVAPECRGKGLGRRIVGEYVRRLGPAKVHLHVHRDNAPAIALYRSLGYAPRSAANYAFAAFTRLP
jgi:ribosomal protein S18 acetylase RimI-like enzyme